LKGDRDRDVLTILSGYHFNRIEALQNEQSTLVFLIARLGAYAIVYTAGLLALTFAAETLPWINVLGWAVIWTLSTAGFWVYWTERSGQRIHEVKNSRLFETLLRAKAGLAALVVAGILAVLSEELLKAVRHHP
jgi:hypothetical protein